MRQRRPVAVDDAEEVDLPDAPQLIRLELLDLGVDGHDRVRDVGVDAAEALDGLRDDALDLHLLGAVGRDGKRLRACPLDFADAVRERLFVAAGDDHLRTAFARLTRDRAPEPAGRTGDDEHLLREGFLPPHLSPGTRTRYPESMVPEIGISGLILILIVALLVFGPKRLPEMGRSLGKGMREFKDSLSGKDEHAELPPPPADDKS